MKVSDDFGGFPRRKQVWIAHAKEMTPSRFALPVMSLRNIIDVDGVKVMQREATIPNHCLSS